MKQKTYNQAIDDVKNFLIFKEFIQLNGRKYTDTEKLESELNKLRKFRK
jgi:hypothetical protein